MKIRSITYFLNPNSPTPDIALKQAGEFLMTARPAFEAAGYEVQTARLATVPFPRLLPRLHVNALLDLAQNLEYAGRAAGYDYISLGPALPDQIESYALIPPVLAKTS